MANAVQKEEAHLRQQIVPELYAPEDYDRVPSSLSVFQREALMIFLNNTNQLLSAKTVERFIHFTYIFDFLNHLNQEACVIAYKAARSKKTKEEDSGSFSMIAPERPASEINTITDALLSDKDINSKTSNLLYHTAQLYTHSTQARNPGVKIDNKFERLLKTGKFSDASINEKTAELFRQKLVAQLNKHSDITLPSYQKVAEDLAFLNGSSQAYLTSYEKGEATGKNIHKWTTTTKRSYAISTAFYKGWNDRRKQLIDELEAKKNEILNRPDFKAKLESAGKHDSYFGISLISNMAKSEASNYMEEKYTPLTLDFYLIALNGRSHIIRYLTYADQVQQFV